MTSRLFHKGSFGNTGSPYQMFFASVLLHLIAIAAIVIVFGILNLIEFKRLD